MIGKDGGLGGRLRDERFLIRDRIRIVGISHMRKKMMYSVTPGMTEMMRKKGNV